MGKLLNILPVSDLRQDAAKVLKKLRDNKEPIIITQRGRAGLVQYRGEFCRLLWRLWSSNLDFNDDDFDRTAVSFDKPDFVVVFNPLLNKPAVAYG
jgi:hypothetical protein